ncbi:MAG: hypothetical protein F4Y02_10660 [Chloroflexi bacterium]|nr:hypothetical protein [Chloroflexota bacterium]
MTSDPRLTRDSVIRNRGREVYIDDQRLGLARSLAVVPHSPTGFMWGYGGSGPAQLALALLLEAGLGDRDADRLHHPFKWEVVAKLPHDGFELHGSTVWDWLGDCADAEALFASMARETTARGLR